MRDATELEKKRFSVKKTGFFCLASTGGVGDAHDAPHIVQESDLAGLIPSTDLAPLFLMHHANLSSVIQMLERKKNMMVIVQKCMIDGYLDTGVANDFSLLHLQNGLFLLLGVEEAIVAGLRILFAFGGADIDAGNAGWLLYYYEGKVTNVKLMYYYNGKRVMLSLIEQRDECALTFYCED